MHKQQQKKKQSAPTHRKLLMVPSLRFLNGGTGCCLQNDIISTVPLKVSFFFFFAFRTDNMPENAGQDGGVLCSRVGTERHWQGNDAEMQHI